MRKLVYYVGSTIDGFIAGPDGEYDFFPTVGDHATYLNATVPETVPTAHRSVLGGDPPNARFDAVVMGRGSYDPARTVGVTSPYAHLRQYVVSRTLPPADYPDVEIVSGDPLAFVRDLKSQQGRDIWLCGGGNLAGQLLPEIDELFVKLYPYVLGSGIPLVDRGFDPRRFTLVEARPFDNGTVVLRYAPAGPRPA
ncbi:dihydrofolate reductase family protein [Micromonospora fluostatini]|uniref:dihydrofolate reductase family protein n=1 Tax=Micromonospora sp. JCM 30529 TaxID=3421643 RepID=UPI003D171167